MIGQCGVVHNPGVVVGLLGAGGILCCVGCACTPLDSSVSRVRPQLFMRKGHQSNTMQRSSTIPVSSIPFSGGIFLKILLYTGTGKISCDLSYSNLRAHSLYRRQPLIAPVAPYQSDQSSALECCILRVSNILNVLR